MQLNTSMVGTTVALNAAQDSKVKPTIVLADDHSIVIEGLRALLANDFQIVATANNGRDVIVAARNFKPDVVILDVSMPRLNGIDAAREIRKNDPKIKIVFLTMHNEPAYVHQAFDAGASGFLLKHSASVDLLPALQRVLSGSSYLSPEVASNPAANPFDALTGRFKRAKSRSAQLSVRQREVLQLVAEGCSAKEAAAALNVSPRTVEFHKYRLMQQLGLHTTAQLTQFAIKHNIISA
jgi:DNA-binding NarL/FixJ family response regulator